jgi:hypothetical protein
MMPSDWNFSIAPLKFEPLPKIAGINVCDSPTAVGRSGIALLLRL